MKNLIVVRGKPSTGKTTVIKKLAEWLENCYSSKTLWERKCQYDIYLVIEINGVKIGVACGGDQTIMIERRLKRFVSWKCNIVICACRLSMSNIFSAYNCPISFIDTQRVYESLKDEENNRVFELLKKQVTALLD